jgi:hypothetical protein
MLQYLFGNIRPSLRKNPCVIEHVRNKAIGFADALEAGAAVPVSCVD